MPSTTAFSQPTLWAFQKLRRIGFKAVYSSINKQRRRFCTRTFWIAAFEGKGSDRLRESVKGDFVGILSCAVWSHDSELGKWNTIQCISIEGQYERLG